MAYLQPTDYGFVQTPAPGGATGTQLKEWIDLDLDLANFHLMAENAATLTTYTFSNPTASTLKIEHDTNGVQKWEGNGLQAGPVLVWKTQIDPRPDYTVAGPTGNQWRSEDCLLQMQMKVAGTFENGGVAADARTLGVGPIFIFLVADEGSGATFVTNDPVPSYKKSGGANAGSYFHARFNRPNDSSTNFDFSCSSNQHAKNMNGLTGPLADTGVPNTIEISISPHYAASVTGSQNDGTCIASCFDSRVTDGGVEYGIAMEPSWAPNIRVEDHYLYLGLAVQNWNSDALAAGTEITIEQIRYLVQPVRNRSLP